MANVPVAEPRGIGEEPLTRLLHRSGALHAVLAPDGRVIEVSPELVALLGGTRPELLGGGVLALVHPDDHAAFEAALDRLATGRPVAGLRTRTRTRDGRGCWLRWDAEPDPARGTIHAVARLEGATVDRSRLERLEEELVSTVSHDLRTPLTTILGALELLGAGAGGPLDDRVWRLLELAVRNTRRLRRRIDDLLDLDRLHERLGDDRVGPQPLGALLEQAVDERRPAASRREVHLVLAELPTPDPLVKVDPDEVRQVLDSYLDNALSCAPAGSSVEVRLRASEEHARIEVVDAGPGIPETPEPRASDRYAWADPTDPRDRGGVGLGLALSREQVHRNGGRVGSHRDAQRSCFWCELPVVAASA